MYLMSAKTLWGTSVFYLYSHQYKQQKLITEKFILIQNFKASIDLSRYEDHGL